MKCITVVSYGYKHTYLKNCFLMQFLALPPSLPSIFFKSQIIFVRHLTFCPPEMVTHSSHHHHPLFNALGGRRLTKPILATTPIPLPSPPKY